MRKPFIFKQFSLFDGNSAMKLSTDAVLLGAFASTDLAKNILDIGTGSGIIALMVAQKSEAQITGIDVDENSVKDALLNFRNSPWSKRLTAIHTSLQDFSDKESGQFDLIVCNPPFFVNSLHSPFERKNISKHNVQLSFPDLMTAISKIIHTKGICSFILPSSEESAFQMLAEVQGFSLRKRTIVFPKRSKQANRVLLEYGRIPAEGPLEQSLVIREEDDSFTSNYKKFTRDFYLDF